MRNITENSEKIISILEEVRSYEVYKENLFRKLDKLFLEYQQKKYTHEEYQKRVLLVLEGKTKSEWLAYYDSYLYSLLKQVEELNDEIFYEAYKNQDFNGIVESASNKKESFAKETSVVKSSEDKFVEETPSALLSKSSSKSEKPEALYADLKGKEKKEQKKLEKLEKTISVLQSAELKKSGEITDPKKIPHPFKDLKEPASAKAPVEKKTGLDLLKGKFGLKSEKDKKKLLAKYSLDKKKELKKPDLAEELAKKTKKESTIGVGSSFGLSFMKTLLKRSKRKGSTERKTLLDLELRKKVGSDFGINEGREITSSAIAEEAKRIKNIIEKRRRPKIYQPSFLGAVANIMIKRISFFLLDTFPDLFKNLYNSLRLANIKILSNTYVNIMVLFSLISFFISLPISFFIFTKGTNAILALPKVFAASAAVMLAVFIGFFSYPSIKSKERRTNINANLPFSINHMSAVASSGVPPTRMFQLIGESKEYGEVSVEISKIVEYIELFGYDFLTAVKSVAAISPSPSFKDFLEGMISTVESGGDLKDFLNQKAEEAMLNYELERQKYVETISTYSDIYTGILIAAPLFFVTALSMVSMLGGAVGGIDVNVITVIGTYVVVPLLNIGFLVFLEMTQPEM